MLDHLHEQHDVELLARVRADRTEKAGPLADTLHQRRLTLRRGVEPGRRIALIDEQADDVAAARPIVQMPAARLQERPDDLEERRPGHTAERELVQPRPHHPVPERC